MIPTALPICRELLTFHSVHADMGPVAMWNLPPPPGFQGLRDDLPLVVYHRDLPHWRQDGAMYFVTFRLHDSLPQAKLRELRLFKTDWERRHPSPRSNDALNALARDVMRRVERWLDQQWRSATNFH